MFDELIEAVRNSKKFDMSKNSTCFIGHTPDCEFSEDFANYYSLDLKVAKRLCMADVPVSTIPDVSKKQAIEMLEWFDRSKTIDEVEAKWKEVLE